MGKDSNPVESLRKAEHKKQVKRLKEERNRNREAQLKGKDPERLRAEIAKINAMEEKGPLDKFYRKKREEIQAMLGKVMVLRKETDVKNDNFIEKTKDNNIAALEMKAAAAQLRTIQTGQYAHYASLYARYGPMAAYNAMIPYNMSQQAHPFPDVTTQPTPHPPHGPPPAFLLVRKEFGNMDDSENESLPELPEEENTTGTEKPSLSVARAPEIVNLPYNQSGKTNNMSLIDDKNATSNLAQPTIENSLTESAGIQPTIEAAPQLKYREAIGLIPSHLRRKKR